MDNDFSAFSEAINQALIKSFIEGFWTVLKFGWPFIVFAILFKIFENLVNKKNDKWKRRR